MQTERFLVTVINPDQSVFTYGVKTIGGRQNAIDKVKETKKGEYFIYATKSDEKANYEVPADTPIKIPCWADNLK